MSSAWSEIKELHRQTTLGAKEGLAFRFFSRPLASTILYFIKDGRITPNQVTILSLLVGISGSLLHVFDLTYRGLIVGGALFMIAHMLDALDGQLARHRKAGSVIGMYFDFFIDELKAYFVYIAIAIRLWRQARAGDVPEWVQPAMDAQPFGVHVILVIAVLGITALAIGISCTQFVKRKEWLEAFPAGTGGGQKSAMARLIGVIEMGGKFVIDYPSYIILLCLIDHVEVYLLVYTAAVALYAVRALSSISLRLWRVNPYLK
ncbi:MAG: CDP-alcohol phosphatidyltransferase family protein [Planctomycetes bacterium]|nr:CDP-alcohol phosphatidyltransferase family protein [Planctomycetota bacterium]